MEVNVPDLVKSVLPKDARNKNVAILKDNWTGPMNHNDPGFLSDDFPRGPPKLYITSESDDFDAVTLAEWRHEGFNVEYLPLGAGGDHYRRTLRSLHKRDLGPCETFGIVAYGEAASLCLEHYHVLDNNHELKLGCLIGYYPTRIPDPGTRFPSAIRVLVHLVVGEIGVVKQSQMVGIQGKKRVVKRNVDRGIGLGGTLWTGYPCYAYEGVEAGFAEHDLEEYDRICAELAWTRSLTTARRAFRNDKNLEAVVEVNSQGKYYSRDVHQAMSTFAKHEVPHVTHVPTLTGGIGAEDLERFYTRYFIDCNPPSMQLTLLSRTIGVDRVVDEIFVTFKHSQDMPWILPGVPATNKRVEIILVSIVTLRGGKLYHEHVYWDQASVLVQVGLLDPKLVPQVAHDKGVKLLPVYGKKAARRVFSGGSEDEDGEADNELIRAWEDGDEEPEQRQSRKAGGVEEKEPEQRQSRKGGGVEEKEPEQRQSRKAGVEEKRKVVERPKAKKKQDETAKDETRPELPERKSTAKEKGKTPEAQTSSAYQSTAEEVSSPGS